jgi:uncharacterized protein
MTIKESILKTLEDIKGLASVAEIYDHILKNNYYSFGAKDPKGVVSGDLREFIFKGDSRIKRTKISKGTYKYYLTKYEHFLILDQFEIESKINAKLQKNDYQEKDLHKILSSYLKSTNSFSKTIFHEQSNTKDSNQKWVHPDMVGVQFINLYSKASQTFLKAINRLDTFKISSYEIKKEINSDYELKKTFFQAVSNSSWANYGYLVAFEISDSLNDEIERLNQSFGIGIIELKANPYESKILYPAKYKDLDFKTIDKLCKINIEFETFIEQIEKLMTATEKYYKSTEKELEGMCDKYFLNDTEIETYCRDRKIPWDNN